MSSQSLAQFHQLLASVDQLIAIHGQLQTGRGRRHEQDALHRAGVVLTVAAWQAYVEKVANEALSFIENSFVGPEDGVVPPMWAKSSFYLRKPAIKKSIGDLNTPNSENVRKLFNQSFGFDPRLHWVWAARRRQWNCNQFSTRTDEWLRIRHTLAHGNDLPANLIWIHGTNGQPRLTLSLLRECRNHFSKLAELTDDAFRDHLAAEHDPASPW